MTTIEEYRTLCEQQRQLIELLLAERRVQSPLPTVVHQHPVPPPCFQTPSGTARFNHIQATVQ